MREGGAHFAERAQAGDMREFGLQLLGAALRLAFFGEVVHEAGE